jgi:NADH dehydrogenase
MKITIVGGGFGGVKAALELAKNKKNDITLISDKPDFQYYPALYSSATGHSHLESWVPLGEILSGKTNITVCLDTIAKIDTKTKKLTAESGKVYMYERCILALGSVTTYFNIEGLDTYAYGIKSAEEIKKLKHHLYTDIAEHHTVDKHYVVIGGGPTGVELAAALGSYLRRLCNHYDVKQHGIKIDLIEAAPRILPRMHEKASARVTKRLKKLGVHVQVGKAVQSETADEIMVSGKPIKSQTVIWTSGVANSPFYEKNKDQFKFAPRGRVAVDQYMRAADSVYVIGDNAATLYTGLAQTALHDAKFVAANFKREQQGYRPREYKAVRPIVIVPVGERWSVFEWYGIRLYGWMAAVLRRIADFVGYTDMLPIGQALGAWHASTVMEDDYFMSSEAEKKNHPAN